MLKGITVTLLERTQSGTDDFNRPIYTETETPVNNVLVAPAGDSDIQSALNLTGFKIEYQLAIPKGDQHSWEGNRVKFYGRIWTVVGAPQMGIEDLIPGPWNMKVGVRSYNGDEDRSE